MTLADLDLGALRFRTHRERADLLASACASNPDLASFETIGERLEGDPIPGITLGYGPRRVTLMAGAHADEPVGPETLTTLVAEGRAARGWGASGGGLADLFERFTFRIIPHVNPAGEVANWGWIERHDPADVAGSLSRFLRWRRRERPGMDVEFGCPDLRPENRAATAFLFHTGLVALHASLLGMAFSEGALLLIEKKWLGSDRDAALPRTAAPRSSGAVSSVSVACTACAFTLPTGTTSRSAGTMGVLFRSRSSVNRPAWMLPNSRTGTEGRAVGATLSSRVRHASRSASSGYGSGPVTL